MTVATHEDVLAIRDLWKVDREMDALRAEAAALAAAVDAGRKEIERLEQGLVEARAEAQRRREGERVLERRLDEYQDRRDKTGALIDKGQVPDFLVAQRQLEQCARIARETETELLGAMEAREEAESAVGRGEADLERARAAVRDARALQARRRPELEARFKELEPLREERKRGVDARYHAPYQDLRRRGRDVLTDIVDGACGACRMRVAPQVAIEVAQGQRCHACRGCGRFFYDAREDEG